jgi:hypothetical protein
MMVACLEVGYRLGLHGSAKDPELTHRGLGAIETAVFALLGLLLGFSFASGTARLDARRQQSAQEATAIDAAYLRLDLLPATDRTEMRQLFREYLDSRLRVYESLPDMNAADKELMVVRQLQMEIWSKALISSRSDKTQDALRLLLPALNEMIGAATVRNTAIYARLPALIC